MVDVPPNYQMDESNELHAYLSGNLTMIIPKKHVISLSDIALGIRTIYLKFNQLTTENQAQLNPEIKDKGKGSYLKF